MVNIMLLICIIVFTTCVNSDFLEDLVLKDIYINPNSTLTVPELIQQNEYPVEVHHVITHDGYILEMHRIPHSIKSDPSKTKPVLFLMHGLLSSSADWVITGPERGLAYLLADRGYDVWMGNARGNFYSRRHTKLTPDHANFWDFSWHEIGVDDLPSMIDYTLGHTNNSQLIYLGYSQGTTTFFVMCSERPEYNSKIRTMFAMGPSAYMTNLKSPFVRGLAHLEKEFALWSKFSGFKELLPVNKLFTIITQEFCNEHSITQSLCTDVMHSIVGFDDPEVDKKNLPVILAHTPAGCSTKQLIHFLQLIKSDFFQQYDYGTLKNLLKYGKLHPPKYDISKITIPITLFYGENDWLADPQDVHRLSSELPNLVGSHLVPYDKFNHLDFLWALHVKKLLYDEMFTLLDKYK